MSNKNFIPVIKTEQVCYLQRCLSLNHFNSECSISFPTRANLHEGAQNSGGLLFSEVLMLFMFTFLIAMGHCFVSETYIQSYP